MQGVSTRKVKAITEELCGHAFSASSISADLPMNVHSRRPDRSPEAIEKRRKAAEQARAANIRQGYVHDPALEEAIVRYVAGDITREEYRQLMIEAPVKITPDQPSRAEGRLLRADSFLLSFAMADERPKVPTPILLRQTIRTGRTF